MIRNVGFLSRHANIRVNEALSLIFQKLDILFVYILCILIFLALGQYFECKVWCEFCINLP